jgi:hypothetical protein
MDSHKDKLIAEAEKILKSDHTWEYGVQSLHIMSLNAQLETYLKLVKRDRDLTVEELNTLGNLMIGCYEAKNPT